jgi:putative methionine-R-sulfoxide reductase with GAF domain
MIKNFLDLPESKPPDLSVGADPTAERSHPKPEQRKGGFFRDLLRAPKFGDPAKDRIAGLQHIVLMGMFFTLLLGLGISILFWTGSPTASFGILLFEVFLCTLAFLWQRRGYLERTSWMLLTAMYLVFVLGFAVAGFNPPVALLLALTVSMAGLLLHYYSVIGVTALCIVTVGVLPYIIDVPIVQPRPNDIPYTLVIFAVEGLLLTVASRTRAQSFVEADQSRQDLLRANSDLQGLAKNLEQRVADRTSDLATVTEVATVTATILETDKLLQAVVDLTQERFNLYHSHIYLFDESGENLVLAAGAGEPGRQMVAEGRSIPLNSEQSLVARAARERKGVTINDVTQAPDFLPNPLLPETRSELAVPMISSGKVIGVFDVQSDQVGRFIDSDINIQTTLAAQVATSIQNVRSFEQAKSQADLESLVNAIGQKIQRTTSVDDTLQTAIREVGLALGAARVSANIGIRRQPDGDQARRN